MDFAFPYWKNYDHAERFGSKEDIDLQKYFANPLPIYNGPRLPEYNVQWGYHDIKLRAGTSLSGHMQSLKYFEHCLDEVKWYFRMKDEYPQNDFIALHIRLGDYDGAYHPRLDKSYYQPALEHFPTYMKVLVFSDDTEAARKIFIGARFSFYDGNYIDTFKMMKSCRHFIIGNSSYSAMAATLGEAKDKIAVAPDPWFGKAYTQITGKDIYNPGWRIVNWENVKQYA